MKKSTIYITFYQCIKHISVNNTFTGSSFIISCLILENMGAKCKLLMIQQEYNDWTTLLLKYKYNQKMDSTDAANNIYQSFYVSLATLTALMNHVYQNTYGCKLCCLS